MAEEWGYSLLRSYPLEDIQVKRDGDGRTVEAYAAVWDTPAEVRDQHGHYTEVIARTAFNKTIKERGDRVPVFFNHGYTAAGTPSDAYSVPIGRSLEIRAEERGLWTLSRYNEGPDADRVLEAIRNGAITAQSFRGRVYGSTGLTPAGRVPKVRAGDAPPTVTRTELGLDEFGPTPAAVYVGAKILALRSVSVLANDLAHLDADGRAELMRMLATSTPLDEIEPEPEAPATSDPDAGAEEPHTPDGEHSGRQQTDIARRIRVALLTRGITR